MTTTSTFPFSTMEAPLVEDSMEMTSPYHGHADDFEIDIDVMEDQASNPDKDMTAADEYMDNSHGGNYGHDDSPDEDMVDDTAEPSMIDADEYRETNQNLGMQYEEGKTYEAEMLEDEYDEDIDAPVPEHEQEIPTSLGLPENQELTAADTSTNDNVNEDGANELSFETEVKHLNENQTGEQQYQEHVVHDSKEQQQADEPAPETTRSEVGYTEELATHHIQGEQGELETTRDGPPPDDSENPQNAEREEGDPEPAQTSFDEPKEADVHSHGEQQLSEQMDKEAEQERESAEYPPLHPVKVYYQENEMSLFPPRAGDSTETFFLEKESLAYGSFEKLFESCREVLQDHINENEVLVMDIDPLNIQISEDSRETDKVTLKQIVDVYLHLCHNDGVEGSEALYLTLSTKLTITAELSDLFLAASEGKGLSEIQPWETYPEADGDSAEFNETAQEPFPQEPQDTLNNGDDQARETGSTTGNQDVPNPEQTEPAAGFAENVEHDDVATTVYEADAQGNRSVDNDSSRPGSHDLEEQNTESTGTIEPLPPTDVPEEQSGAGDEATDLYDGENNEDEYYYHDDATHHEEEDVQVDAIEFLDNEENVVGDITGTLSEEHTEGYQDLERSYREPEISEDIAGDNALRDHEAVSVDKLQTQDSKKETESLLKVSSSTLQSQGAPPSLDHSLGTAEDLLESSGNDSKADVELDQIGDAIEPEGLGEIVEPTSDLPANEKESADLPFDDEDEDYLNLGFEEDHDGFDEDIIASPSHVSAKRTREPEDELDLPESPTPEVKRSRSS